MTTCVDNINKFTGTLQDKFSKTGFSIKTYILNTPPEVIISLVASIALQIFDTKLALPSYGLVLGSILSRLAIYIVGNINKEFAHSIKEAVTKFHTKFAIIPIILMVIATTLAWFIPQAGFAAGFAIGLYYGPITESIRHIDQQKISPNIIDTQPLGL